MQVICDRKILLAYLRGLLEEDDRLDFLIHLDACPRCWEAVYNATKAAHPHYYKKPPKKSHLDERDLRRLESGKKGDQEEVFEVA
jgi:anti-sigma factor RsiW